MVMVTATAMVGVYYRRPSACTAIISTPLRAHTVCGCMVPLAVAGDGDGDGDGAGSTTTTADSSAVQSVVGYVSKPPCGATCNCVGGSASRPSIFRADARCNKTNAMDTYRSVGFDIHAPGRLYLY